MTRYPIHPRDIIFAKGYGFLSFPKNMDKYIGKNIIKNLSGKYSQTHLHHAKKSATDAIKTFSKRQVTQLVIKLLIKLQKIQKIHNKIIQGQL